MNRFYSLRYFLFAATICCCPATAVGWFAAKEFYVAAGLAFVVSIVTAFLCLVFATDAGKGEPATVSHLINGKYKVWGICDWVIVKHEKGYVGLIKTEGAMLPEFEVKNGKVLIMEAPPPSQPTSLVQ